MNSATHELKTWPEYFDQVFNGNKTFELRKNDRDFKQGDILILKEWNNIKGEYTGRQCVKQVSYILNGGNFGLSEGFVVMGLKPLPSDTVRAEEVLRKHIDFLIEQMAGIREAANKKQEGRTNKLSEPYIEASACIEVINHLLPTVAKITTAMHEYSSLTAKVEGDGVEFAEWATHNYLSKYKGKWYKDVYDEEFLTTTELYQIFKNQKQKL